MECYSVNKGTVIHATEWVNLKSSMPEASLMVTCCMIPSTRHFGKGKL